MGGNMEGTVVRGYNRLFPAGSNHDKPTPAVILNIHLDKMSNKPVYIRPGSMRICTEDLTYAGRFNKLELEGWDGLLSGRTKLPANILDITVGKMEKDVFGIVVKVLEDGKNINYGPFEISCGNKANFGFHNRLVDIIEGWKGSSENEAPVFGRKQLDLFTLIALATRSSIFIALWGHGIGAPNSNVDFRLYPIELSIDENYNPAPVKRSSGHWLHGSVEKEDAISRGLRIPFHDPTEEREFQDRERSGYYY